jgi:hypothetical protein
MKKPLFALLLTVIAFAAAWSQPKVAVLDAIIPQNMDPSIQGPATEKLIEKLVQSNRFTVLDRANIESVLKEREFQVSGMVSDQDVVTAGKYLGADYVVVAKLSKVGDTNFISGKMINVKTGVIVSQTSAQGDGKLTVLITLAGQVGEALSGGASSPPAENKEVVVTPQPVTPAAPEAPQQAAAAAKSVSPRGELADSFIGIGLFSNQYHWKWSGDYSSYSDSIEDKYKFGTVQFQIVAVKYIQLGIGFTWFSSATESYTLDAQGKGSASYDVDKDYAMTNLDLNFLFRIPIRLGQSSVAIVPMAGFEYDINLSYKDADGNDLTTGMSDEEKSNLNMFFLQIGAGFQIDIGNVVLYPEVIYGFKLPSQLDSDNEDYYSSLGYKNSSISAGRLDLGVIVGFKM